MHHNVSIVVVTVTVLAAVTIVGGLNLADVPCGSMGSGSRRYFGRVIGGAVADISDFPYTVSIKKRGEHYCGGSLINKDFVVTAAHCLNGFPQDIWSITVGEQNRGVTEPHEQTFGVNKTVIHGGFKFPKQANDIAIMKLSASVDWNDHVQPICLPDAGSETFFGKQGLLAGWGFDAERGNMTEELHFAKLPIMDNSKCQEMYDKVNEENKKNIKIIEEQICAGHPEGMIDGCQGDSGGALVSHVDQKMMLVGIMSGGLGCGRPNTPGVYTNVRSYLSWISETIAKWDEPQARTSRQHWTGADLEHQRSAHMKRDVDDGLDALDDFDGVVSITKFPGLSAMRQVSY